MEESLAFLRKKDKSGIYKNQKSSDWQVTVLANPDDVKALRLVLDAIKGEYPELEEFPQTKGTKSLVIKNESLVWASDVMQAQADLKALIRANSGCLQLALAGLSKLSGKALMSEQELSKINQVPCTMEGASSNVDLIRRIRKGLKEIVELAAAYQK